MLRIAFLACVLACGSSSSPPPPKDKPAPADAHVIGPDPAPVDVGDLPPECGLYKAMVSRLSQCEVLGPQRDLLEKQFSLSWKAWAQLPPTERATVAIGCRAGADAVRAAAAGPCSW